MKNVPLSISAKQVLAILRADPKLILLVFQRQGSSEEHPVILRGQNPVRRVHQAIFRELRDHHLIEVMRMSPATNEVIWVLAGQGVDNELVA
ncbi:MAG: hypothetical protein SH847_18370 [Roseiflexaceae bacterium]|nr:hypothetical protein [Roseiflexaceae bacterium]